MDPNETLRLFRESYTEYSRLFDQAESVENEDGLSALTDLHEEMADYAETAAGHAHELFEWLANGGFAPDWTVTTLPAILSLRENDAVMTVAAPDTG